MDNWNYIEHALAEIREWTRHEGRPIQTLDSFPKEVVQTIERFADASMQLLLSTVDCKPHGPGAENLDIGDLRKRYKSCIQDLLHACYRHNDLNPTNRISSSDAQNAAVALVDAKIERQARELIYEIISGSETNRITREQSELLRQQLKKLCLDHSDGKNGTFHKRMLILYSQCIRHASGTLLHRAYDSESAVPAGHDETEPFAPDTVSWTSTLPQLLVPIRERLESQEEEIPGRFLHLPQDLAYAAEAWAAASWEFAMSRIDHHWRGERSDFLADDVNAKWNLLREACKAKNMEPGVAEAYGVYLRDALCEEAAHERTLRMFDKIADGTITREEFLQDKETLEKICEQHTDGEALLNNMRYYLNEAKNPRPDETILATVTAPGGMHRHFTEAMDTSRTTHATMTR